MPLPLFKDRSKQEKNSITTSLAIASGKGGVGKSTVTAQLAYTLGRLGKRVGVLDADVYGPSMGKMLSQKIPPSQRGLHLFPAIGAYGIQWISPAHFRGEEEAAAIRAPLANRWISQCIEQVVWGELDFLLIDFPPGTGDIQLTLSQKIPLSGALMVTTPQEVAVLDVKKALDFFLKLQIPVWGVVENMSYFRSPSGEPLFLFGQGGGRRLAEEKGIALLAEIPLSPELCQAGERGEAIFSEEKQVEAALVYQQLAEQLVQRQQVVSPDVQISWLGKEGMVLHWPDGKRATWRFADLQRLCPCARCRGNISEQSSVASDVTADKIERVGHYGIRVHFSAGCRAGIYGFAELKGS